MKSNTEMKKQIDLEKLKARMLDALSGKGFNNAATCGEVLELLDHIAALEKENASLKQDAARYQWLIKQSWFQQAFDRFEPDDGGMQKRFESECARIIDTAMEASNA